MTRSGQQFSTPRAWKSTVAALALASAVLAGCDTSESLTGAAAHPGMSAATAADHGQQLARALAAAMGEPQVRAQVMSAMRDSRFREHKLVLQEFLNAPRGRPVLAKVAQAAGVSTSTVQGWASTLPSMDLYVPLEVHRRGWKGTDDFVVGLNMDTDDPTLTGYRPDGSTVRLDARAGAPALAVVLLHPAEPKYQRGKDMPELADLDVVGTDPEAPPCDRECGGEEESGTRYTGGEVHGFKNYIADGWGAVELMVKTYPYSGGSRIDEQSMSEGGACLGTSQDFCYPEWAYPHRNIGMGSYIKVWERDSGTPEWGDDDYWGDATFTGYKQVHRFWAPCTITGANSTPYCATYDPNWMFHSSPSVDIVFWHITSGWHDQ